MARYTKDELVAELRCLSAPAPDAAPALALAAIRAAAGRLLAEVWRFRGGMS